MTDFSPGIKRSERDVHSHQSNAEVQNEWSYESTTRPYLNGGDREDIVLFTIHKFEIRWGVYGELQDPADSFQGKKFPRLPLNRGWMSITAGVHALVEI